MKITREKSMLIPWQQDIQTVTTTPKAMITMSITKKMRTGTIIMMIIMVTIGMIIGIPTAMTMIETGMIMIETHTEMITIEILSMNMMTKIVPMLMIMTGTTSVKMKGKKSLYFQDSYDIKVRLKLFRVS